MSSDDTYLPGFEPEKPSETTAPPTETVHEHERKKREENGWSKIPDDLPREEIIVTDPAAEAKGLTRIGYEISEKLARRETRFFVKVIKRAKYANPENALSGVVTAPQPVDPFGIEGARTKFDSTFVVGIVVDKHVVINKWRVEIMGMQMDIAQAGTCQMCCIWQVPACTRAAASPDLYVRYL